MKLDDMNNEQLILLSTYLNLFPKDKTIKTCMNDIEKVIKMRAKRRENLKKAKVISLENYRKLKKEE